MIEGNPQSYKGFFIALEGSDGSGKTTVYEALKSYFTESYLFEIDGEDDRKKLGIVYSREPGGTHIGEEIRDILLDPLNKEMGARPEALLYAASRAQHVDEKILPALREGKLFISDRFMLSSLAYQGAGRELGIEEVYRINYWATGGLLPDLTIFLDVDPLTVLRRKAANEEKDRLEEAGDDFFKKVYNGYMNATKYMPKLIVIDASKSKEEVIKACIRALETAIGGWLKSSDRK